MRFDVGNIRYTTRRHQHYRGEQLRFDVGNIRYTTRSKRAGTKHQLRFDVGNIRYTTVLAFEVPSNSQRIRLLEPI